MAKTIKNAFISGANKGIGLALVKNLLKREEIQNVYATHRPEADTKDLKELTDKGGLHLVELRVDEETAFKRAAALIEEETDSLDLVINSIGTLHDEVLESPERRLEDLSIGNLQHSFLVNTIPTGLLARFLKPFLRKAENPVFAALSAKVGSVTDNQIGGWYAYRSSKAALNMLLKTISIELTRLNEQSIVLALHPGTVETNLSKPFIEMAKKKYKVHTPEEAATNLMQVIDSAEPSKNGAQYLSWDGDPLPW